MEDSKAMPLGIAPQDRDQLLARRPSLTQLPTPLVTLSEAAMEHNLGTMARWRRDAGVDLAPHGKTTMSRELWRRQLDAGAWGITVATPWQAQVALDWQVPQVLLANALVQPAALRALAPDVGRLTVWSDCLRGVEIMERTLADAEPDGPSEQLSVLVELGGSGGRTGARSIEQALEIARAVAAADHLRLAGVAGYEGALAHDHAAASLQRVDEYLGGLASLHREVAAESLYPADGDLLLTAGGSAYFDQVVEVLGPLRDERTRVVLRSGAYLIHDDGFYRGISPLARSGGEESFRSAMHAWVTVVSAPEDGLVLVDGGKRDLSFDEGMPEPQLLRRLGEEQAEPLVGARCTAMNDQHTFVQVPPQAGIEVGDVLRLGLSHPCTVLDKWRHLVTIDDDRSPEPRAVGTLATTFG